MQDLHLRRFVAVACAAAAVMLIAVSVLMNCSYWMGQATDTFSALMLGAVSIAVDVFKAVLPLVIAWAWLERFWLGCIIATILFAGSLVFSVSGELGFTASTRAVINGGHEALESHYTSAERDLGDTKDRIAALGLLRPKSVIEELLAKTKQDRRWSSSKECADLRLRANVQFCQNVSDLRVELASAIESEGLRKRGAQLQAELKQLLASGARLEQDPQARLLERLTGLPSLQVQSSIVVLLATLVEIGAAFGFYIAALPMRSLTPTPSPAREAIALPRSTTPAASSRTKPTRFVRAPGGKLMIE